jgi:hypothetical protein
MYFIRHGHADYYNDCLTRFGLSQVERLCATLETHLSDSIDAILVTSPAGRTFETAQMLIPLLERKVGKKLYIDRETLLSQEHSMGSDEFILEHIRENAVLVEKYHDSGYGFFVAHDRIIVATCIGIAEKYAIPIPDFLQLIEDQPDECTIEYFMRTMKSSREEALEKIRSYHVHPVIELPPIREASAVHIDLIHKELTLIVPS